MKKRELIAVCEHKPMQMGCCNECRGKINKLPT